MPAIAALEGLFVAFGTVASSSEVETVCWRGLGQVAVDEGQALGSFTYENDINECAMACAAMKQCMSFAACPQGGQRCYFKSRVIRSNDPVRDVGDGCQTFFQASCHSDSPGDSNQSLYADDVGELRTESLTRIGLAMKVEDMYTHAFESYMAHAFPSDELRPLSCDGRFIRERGDLDSLIGNYSMTLIDALDSLVIFRRYDDFERAVEHIVTNVDFAKDIEVSTFEVNIRLLGGLLSGHMHAQRVIDGYSGGLLAKAVDLANRLKPAFETPTGLPVPRVNLLRGMPKSVSAQVTIAEAGSFILEFGVLSMLTGDGSYYNTAKRALLVFWHRRSSLDLVGTVMNVMSGDFENSQSSTGAGQDSYYEYLIKGYVLFDDLELLDMFHKAYAAAERVMAFEGFTYNVDMFKGTMTNSHLSPFSCVWGSLQVLAGDVVAGLRTVIYWHRLWKKHKALPEVFNMGSESPTNIRDAPLRPELIEAAFYLSLALPDDETVLGVARDVALALDEQSRVACGFAAVADVTTKRLDDRMDSFFLSETLVYLYLTLAPPEELERSLPWPLGSVVFSTEGHMFPVSMPGIYAVRRMPDLAARLERIYPTAIARPILTCEAPSPFERVAMQARCEQIAVMTPQYQQKMQGHSSRICRSQEATVVVRSPDEKLLRFQAVVSSFGPELPGLPSSRSSLLSWRSWSNYAASFDNDVDSAWPNNQSACGAALGDVNSEVSGLTESAILASAAARTEDTIQLPSMAFLAPPGGMAAWVPLAANSALPWSLLAEHRLVLADPLEACAPLRQPPGGDLYNGRVVVARRGSCLFLQKLQHMQKVRAAMGIIVDSPQSDELQVMTCPLQERGAGRDVHIPAIMISHDDGERLLDLLSSHPIATVTSCASSGRRSTSLLASKLPWS